MKFQTKKLVLSALFMALTCVATMSIRIPTPGTGGYILPAGTYDALQINIGRAKGHNWWCVLYPNLCFIDAVHAVVPEDGKKELQEVLTEEEYDLVTSDAKVKVRWFFFPEKDDK